MNNFNLYTSDKKFFELSEHNKNSILKIDEVLSKEGYIFNGNWRCDASSDGCNSSFEIITSKIGRKNLITIRPMKNFLKIEVYWGISKNIPMDKKLKMYFNIMPEGEISQALIKEIRELYNYFFES